MKYTTFTTLRTLGLVGVVVAAFFGISQCNSNDAPEALPRETQTQTQTQQIPQQTQTRTQPQVTSPSAAIQYGTDILPKTTNDDVVFKTQMEPNSVGKPDDKNGGLKWTVRKNGLKLYLKSDTHKGYDFWNRVKVDYQDNGKWDEQWIFSKNGAVRREVAVKEDENFDMIYTLEGNQWVLKK